MQPVPIHIQGSRKESQKQSGRTTHGPRGPHHHNHHYQHHHQQTRGHAPPLHSANAGPTIVNKKKSSSSLASRFPSQLSAEQLLDPASLESKKDPTTYRVVQRLLPDVSLARHIVDSDDHAFASYDECCHDMNNNSTEAQHSGIFLPIFFFRDFYCFIYFFNFYS